MTQLAKSNQWFQRIDALYWRKRKWIPIMAFSGGKVGLAWLGLEWKWTNDVFLQSIQMEIALLIVFAHSLPLPLDVDANSVPMPIKISMKTKQIKAATAAAAKQRWKNAYRLNGICIIVVYDDGKVVLDENSKGKTNTFCCAHTL